MLTHNLLTHNLSTHNLSSHNLSSHNLSSHNLLSHNLLTHNLSPHSLLTHNLSSHNLSPHNLLSHTTLRGRRGTYGSGLAVVARLVPSWRRGRRGCRGSLRGRRGTWRHRPSLCVAGVALGDIDHHFAWQAWHSWHWAGSGRALGSQLTPWSPRLFAWQAWQLATSASTLRGRRALGDIDVHSAWRACHSWHWAGSGGWRACFPVDAGDAVALWVARVALGDIDRHFAWQAWHLATSTFTLRGRRGTYGTGLALVARLVPSWQRGRRSSLHGRRGTWRHGTGLALVARLVPSWCRCRRGSLRGRRGTWRHRPSLCVAGVALGDIDRHFAWQEWHLWHWAGSALCVAGVALGDIDVHSARQAWHLWRWAGSGGALGSQLTPWTPWLFAWQAWHLATSTTTWRGRRAFCVAGVALMALGWLWWRAWFPVDAVVAAALCVAGVALGDIDHHFAWQAWHLVTWTCTLHGRRGIYGTGLALVARLVPSWKMFSSGTSALFCFGSSYTYTRTHTHAHIAHAFRWPHTAHIHTHAHAHIHFHARFFHTHYTHHFYALSHTLLSRTSLRHTFVARADPSPSLFSFLCISHPIFTFLLLLIGRSWHVGLSGPLIFGFLVPCFPASLLFCFLLFLLCLSASLLYLLFFSASLLYLLLCFCDLPVSFLFCFSAFPSSLLFCFCASVPFYFYCSTFSFLRSCVFAALLPAPLLLCFLSLLPLSFFLLLYFLLFVNTLGETQRNLKENLIKTPDKKPYTKT